MPRCMEHSDNGMNEALPFYSGEKNTNMIKIALRLFSMIIQSSRSGLFVQLAVSVIGGVLPAVTAMLWKNILSIASDNSITENTRLFMIPVISLAFCGGLSASYYFFTEVIDSIFRNQMSRKLQEYVHRKVEKLPVAYFEIPQLNDTITIAQNAFSYGPAASVALSITGVISGIVAIITAGIVLWNFHYTLVFILFLATIPYLFKLYANKINLDFNLRTSEKRREASEYVRYFTSYEYIKETQIWGAKEFFLDKWQAVLKAVKKEELKINIKVIGIHVFYEIINSIGYIFSIFMAGYLLLHNDIGIGELGGVLLLIGQVNDKMSFLFDMFGGLHGDLSSVAKGFDFLDLKEEPREINQATNIEEGIHFQNVSFCYPLAEAKVIENVTIDINAGEIVALVGANGAGKSTFAKLILGLLKPNQGRVLYDDEDISKIAYLHLHKNATAVFQDFNHYYTSVRDNILLGDSEKEDDPSCVHDAAEKAGAGGFIDELPDGMNTQLGKQYEGTELSGGQWQLLAIARGFYKNAGIIVLDEPSSALDSYNEEAVYNNFKELCKGKTGVIVTHRLGAASLADKIILLDKGKIVECGSHEQLCRQKGRYWELFESQASLYRA